MKLRLLIQLSCLLLLVGCGQNKLIKSEVNNNICVEKAYFNGDTSIVEADKGYYILHSSFGSFYITYKSKERDEEIYLCNKPECSHIYDDINEPMKYMTIREDCNANIGKNGILNSIKMYDGKLYVLLYENSEAVLYRISKDGSTHERLFSLGTLSSNTSGWYNYIVNDENVYVSHMSENYEQGEPSQIIKYSIDGKDKKVLYEDSEHLISQMILYNGGLFLRSSDAKTGMDSKLYRLDLGSGKAEVVAGEHAVKYTIDNANNAMYYWEMGKGLIKYDLNTGVETLVRKSDSSMLSANVASNQKYVFLDNSLGRYYRMDNETNPDKTLFVEVIDLQTENVVGKLEIPEEFDIVISCDDENIICTNLSNYIYYKVEDIVK